MPRRLVEHLVVPKAERRRLQQLREREGDRRREDQIVQPGIDPPGAQEVRHDFVGSGQVRLLDFVQPRLHTGEVTAKSLDPGPQLGHLRVGQHPDRRRVTIGVKARHLLGAQAVCQRILRAIAPREHIEDRSVLARQVRELAARHEVPSSVGSS